MSEGPWMNSQCYLHTFPQLVQWPGLSPLFMTSMNPLSQVLSGMGAGRCNHLTPTHYFHVLHKTKVYCYRCNIITTAGLRVNKINKIIWPCSCERESLFHRRRKKKKLCDILNLCHLCFQEEDLRQTVEESSCLQRTYEKYVDLVLVNEDFDITFRKVVEALDALSTEHQWVPVNWVY
jgi:hypothetical protein